MRERSRLGCDLGLVVFLVASSCSGTQQGARSAAPRDDAPSDAGVVVSTVDATAVGAAKIPEIVNLEKGVSIAVAGTALTVTLLESSWLETVKPVDDGPRVYSSAKLRIAVDGKPPIEVEWPGSKHQELAGYMWYVDVTRWGVFLKLWPIGSPEP